MTNTSETLMQVVFQGVQWTQTTKLTSTGTPLPGTLRYDVFVSMETRGIDVVQMLTLYPQVDILDSSKFFALLMYIWGGLNAA
jgi:hypothetical protein